MVPLTFSLFIFVVLFPSIVSCVLPFSMATLSSITAHKLPSLTKSIAESQGPCFPPSMLSAQFFTKSNPSSNLSFSTRKRSCVIWSVTEDREVVPVKENLNIVKDEEERLFLNDSEEFQPLSTSERTEEDDDFDGLVSKAINASIVLGFGTFVVSKLLTIDHDYWHVSDFVC